MDKKRSSSSEPHIWERLKSKLDIRTRFLFELIVLVIIGSVASMGIGYFWGYRLIRTTIGSTNVQLANVISQYVSELVDEEVDGVQTFSTSLIWQQEIANSNSKYANMTSDEMKNYFRDMDKEWITVNKESSLVKTILNNNASIRARSFMEHDNDVAELFVTDKFGGLVGASDKTSDFYQADEEWWQKAFYGNRVVIENISYDESSGVDAITIACPVKDSKGELIGVCKAVVNVEDFFKPLDELEIGKTGRAVITDDKHFIIYRTRTKYVKPLTQKFCDDANFRKLEKARTNWQVIRLLYRDSPVLVSHVHLLANQYLNREGIMWSVFVNIDKDEAYASLRRYMLKILLGSAILLPLTFLLWAKFL